MTFHSRSAQPVAILATGVASALGTAPQALAAATAGLVRFRPQSDFAIVEAETGELVELQGAPASPCTDGFEATGRLVRLATAAIADLARHHRISPDTAIYFALGAMPAVPDTAEEEAPVAGTAAWAEATTALIAKHAGVPQSPPTQVFLGTKSSTLDAMRAAMDGVRNGRNKTAVVVAVDSLIEPSRLAALLASGRLKTPTNPVGLVPGEAAIALLLGASSPRAPDQVVLHPIQQCNEPTSGDRPPTGRALAGAMVAATSDSATAPSTVYVDANGEPGSAQMFGNALVHLPTGSALRTTPRQFPATNFGDTGIAAPLLYIALARHRLLRRRSGAASALVTVIDEDGTNAAVLASLATE